MKKGLLLIAFIHLTASLMPAHPHLFVSPQVILIINGNVLEKIELIWTWDEWWSRDVLDYCDLDYDGIFNDEETDLVRRDFFNGLKNYDYFMILKINGKKKAVQEIEDFLVTSCGRIVTYTFSVPLNIALDNETEMKIIFNDETIYTSFDLNLPVMSVTENAVQNLKTGKYSYYGVQAEFTISIAD